MIFNY